MINRIKSQLHELIFKVFALCSLFLAAASTAGSPKIGYLFVDHVSDRYELKISDQVFYAPQNASFSDFKNPPFKAASTSHPSSRHIDDKLSSATLALAGAAIDIYQFYKRRDLVKFENNDHVENLLTGAIERRIKTLDFDTNEGPLFSLKFLLMSLFVQHEALPGLRAITNSLEKDYSAHAKRDLGSDDQYILSFALSRAYQFMASMPQPFPEVVAFRRKAAAVLLPVDHDAAKSLVRENQRLALHNQILYFDFYLSHLLRETIETSGEGETLDEKVKSTVDEYLEVYDYSEPFLKNAFFSLIGGINAGPASLSAYHDDHGAAFFDFLWSGVVNFVSLQNLRRGLSAYNDRRIKASHLTPEAADDADARARQYFPVFDSGSWLMKNLISSNLYGDVRVQAREIMRFKAFFGVLLHHMNAHNLDLKSSVRELEGQICDNSTSSPQLKVSCKMLQRFKNSTFFAQTGQLGHTAYLGLPNYPDKVSSTYRFSLNPVQEQRTPRWFMPFEDLNLEFAEVLDVVESNPANEFAKFVTAFNVWMIGIFPFQIERFVHSVGVNISRSLHAYPNKTAPIWKRLVERFPDKFGSQSTTGNKSFAQAFGADNTLRGEDLLQWLTPAEIKTVLSTNGSWQNMNLIGRGYMQSLYPLIMKAIRSGVVQGSGPRAAAVITFLLIETADGCTIRWGKIIHDIYQSTKGHGDGGVHAPSQQIYLNLLTRHVELDPLARFKAR